MTQRFSSLTQLALHEVPKFNLKFEASMQSIRKKIFKISKQIFRNKCWQCMFLKIKC